MIHRMYIHVLILLTHGGIKRKLRGDVSCTCVLQVSRSRYVFDDGGQLFHAEERKIHKAHQSDLWFGKLGISGNGGKKISQMSDQGAKT